MTAPTLTEFLLARIAEDEAVARGIDAPLPIDRLTVVSLSSSGKSVGIQIPPARVLAECEAKRAIVEARPLPVGHTWDMIRAWHDSTLKRLAAVYADHPDYDEAWRA